jgi:hypothetical protein
MYPWLQTMMLAVESNDVIMRRLFVLCGGGSDARLEAHQMVFEKISAGIEAAGTLLSGGSTETIIERYREHVAANAERLTFG